MWVHPPNVEEWLLKTLFTVQFGVPSLKRHVARTEFLKANGVALLLAEL